MKKRLLIAVSLFSITILFFVVFNEAVASREPVRSPIYRDMLIEALCGYDDNSTDAIETRGTFTLPYPLANIRYSIRYDGYHNKYCDVIYTDTQGNEYTGRFMEYYDEYTNYTGKAEYCICCRI